MQLTPKKIQAQSLKKQSIVGAAASRIHSVVYNAFDLFTFGLNQGQLGYYQSDNNESCQTTPRKISMPIEIKQVIANVKIPCYHSYTKCLTSFFFFCVG
jgi:hypothetical protein